MPINFEEILNFVQILSEQKSLRATVDKSVKGACITGGFTLVGSLLGGPAGLLIGNKLNIFFNHFEINTYFRRYTWHWRCICFW